MTSCLPDLQQSTTCGWGRSVLSFPKSWPEWRRLKSGDTCILFPMQGMKVTSRFKMKYLIFCVVEAVKYVAAGCPWCPKFIKVQNVIGQTYEEKKFAVTQNWELMWVCQLLNDVVKGLITVSVLWFSIQPGLWPVWWQLSGVHILDVQFNRWGGFTTFFDEICWVTRYLRAAVLCVWHKWCHGFSPGVHGFWLLWQLDAEKRFIM